MENETLHIDFLASHRHYGDHMEPIAEALKEQGVEVRWFTSWREMPRDNVVGICCATGDLNGLQKRGRRSIFCEHGAGQTYSNTHSSYAGGRNRRNVLAFLNPGPHVTEANKRPYPLTKQFEIGCPKLDKWAGYKPEPNGQRPLVVVSFHWDCKVAPETRSAFNEYSKILPTLLDAQEYRFALHSHPRQKALVKEFASKNGIPFIEHFDEVMERAHIYCIDNSSTLFEFAATDRPVVVINSKHYRRGINHGLRFWDLADIGVNCDRPDDLHVSILDAIADRLTQRQARWKAVSKVYTVPLGQATQAATDAIIEILREDPVIVSEYRLQATRHLQGYAGNVGPGWTIDLFRDHCVVTDTEGRQVIRNYIPRNVEARAQEMIGTGFYKRVPVPAPDKPKPAENKMVYPPENKSGLPLDERYKKPAEVTEQAAKLDSLRPHLDQLVLECVADGLSKSATRRAIGSDEDYTYKQVDDCWDRLVATGAIIEYGRHKYKVAAK